MQVTKTFSLDLHKYCIVKIGAQPEVYCVYMSRTGASKKAKARRVSKMK